MPLQLMAVGVMDGMSVGRGVLVGVKVKVGGCGLPLAGLVGANWVLVATPEEGVFTLPVALGTLVEVGTKVFVGSTKTVEVAVGTMEGVADSAANESGMAEPTIGTEIKNVLALAETTVIGSMGRIGIIGS